MSCTRCVSSRPGGDSLRPRFRSLTRGSQGGFTLVEIAVASVILVVALGALTSSVLSGLKLSQTNAENARAEAELRTMLAEIQAVDLDDIFATFNANPADDPGGPGTARGANFEVAGMTAAEDDADGFAGEIIFPAVWNGPVLELREDVVDPAFNMPRDLSGDGPWDDQDHADDYVILPVRVRVRWTGASGVRSVERSLLLAQ